MITVSSCGVNLQEVFSGLVKNAKTLDIHMHALFSFHLGCNLLPRARSFIYVLLSRQHSGAEQCHIMQTLGHQVVGRNNATHEDVRLMYENFFGGKAVRVKKALKSKIGLIPARKLLSNIFQVTTRQ